MPENLKVELREGFGKGAARQIRREGKVPAVLYGHGAEPQHLALPAHESALIARNANALIELDIAGGGKELAIIKDIQRHVVRRELLHLDLLKVKRGEKVEVNIPIILTGEPVSPAVAFVDLQELTILADVLKLPESLEVSVEGLEEGAQIFVGDLELPEGAELVSDAEQLAVSVAIPQVDESDLETPEAEDAAGAEAAEGESAEGAADSDESEENAGE